LRIVKPDGIKIDVKIRIEDLAGEGKCEELAS